MFLVQNKKVYVCCADFGLLDYNHVTEIKF